MWLSCVEERHKKKVLVMPIDFSSGLEVYHEISQQLQELDVGILGKLCNVFGFMLVTIFCNYHLS